LIVPENEILQRVKEAANDMPDWYIVGQRLGERAASPEDPIWSFVWAFQYRLLEPDEEEQRERWGVFGPNLETSQGVFPPPLNIVEDTRIRGWAAIANEDTNAVISSRLHDLLWERKWGKRPDVHARAAIDAYVALAVGPWDSLDRANCLTRALEIAILIKDSGRQPEIISLCIEASRKSMQSPQPEPGVALRLIEALVRTPRSSELAELNELLNEAESTYKDNPWVSETVLALKASRVREPAELEKVRIDQVEHWREEARKEKGLRKLFHLQHALELAHKYGLKKQGEDLKRDLQSLSDDELDLKEVSASVNIPTDKVESFLSAFVDTTNWKESLTAFGSYGPPSGDYSRNVENVRKLMQEHPIQFLVTKIVLGHGNIPIRIAGSEEEHQDVALSQEEARAIGLWSVFAVQILDRMVAKHGKPMAEELSRFFSTPLIPEDTAERIARSLLLYWEDTPDESCHVIVPRIESTIRNLARDLGLLSSVNHSAASQVPSVRLEMLSGVLKDSWTSRGDGIFGTSSAILSEPIYGIESHTACYPKQRKVTLRCWFTSHAIYV
jgi:hypothetical protein